MNDRSRQEAPIIRVEGAGADSQYGRRVEMDRSWTIYHVFTGVPALVCGQSMTGLNRADATCGMLRLNSRGAARPLSPLNKASEYRP